MTPTKEEYEAAKFFLEEVEEESSMLERWLAGPIPEKIKKILQIKQTEIKMNKEYFEGIKTAYESKSDV